MEDQLCNKRASRRQKSSYCDYKSIFAEHGIEWSEDALCDVARYGNNPWYMALTPRQRAIIYFIDERFPLSANGPEETLELNLICK